MSESSCSSIKPPRTRFANSVARPSYNEEDIPSDTDSTHEDRAVMRVGKDYQVKIPDISEDNYDSPHEALLVWKPCVEKLSYAQVDEFVKVAKEQHKYSEEQALGMLFWHKHDVDKALTDLGNFAPFPDEWTMEEKVLFEQAFSYHGKSFYRIKEMLPDKTTAALVKYYYGWKKSRTKRSLMDTMKDFSKNGDLSDWSDSEAEDLALNSDVPICGNCKTSKQHLQATKRGLLCLTCHQYLKRTGLMRPFAPTKSTGSQDSELNPQRYNPTKNRKRPPKGMYMNEDDLKMIANTGQEQKTAILDNVLQDLSSLKTLVQTNKQTISNLKSSLKPIDQYRISQPLPKTTQKWSQEDLLIAVQGVRKYGKDFKTISEVLGNKTPAQVRTFFVAYRTRYNLDEALKDYERESGVKQSFDEEPMEVDEVNDVESLTPPPILKSPSSPSSRRSPKPKLNKPQLKTK